jgi:hypothetical protein
MTIINVGGGGGVGQPLGRLTLQTGVPIQTSDQTAKTTIYYDSFIGNTVPVYNGSSFQSMTIGSDEISMGLDSGVPHISSGSVYDIFAINNSGTLVIAAGPAWTSTTARGTGAGTTELQRVSGLWTNKNSMTHAWGGASGTTDYGSVSANQGTYLGTFYATANGQTGVNLTPAAGSGGTNNFVALFNGYNRVPANAYCMDSTSSWTYATATWRGTDSSSSNRVSFVDGLQAMPINAILEMGANSPVSSVAFIGINLDSAGATPGMIAQYSANSTAISTFLVESVFDSWYPQLGLHYIQGMEFGAAGTTTFYGFYTGDSNHRQLSRLTVRLQI